MRVPIVASLAAAVVAVAFGAKTLWQNLRRPFDGLNGVVSFSSKLIAGEREA